MAVATGLVRLAMSKTVSRVIGSSVGSTDRLPNARAIATFPRRPTTTTAPGTFFSPIARAIASSTRASREGSKPRVSGLASGKEARAEEDKARRGRGRIS